MLSVNGVLGTSFDFVDLSIEKRLLMREVSPASMHAYMSVFSRETRNKRSTTKEKHDFHIGDVVIRLNRSFAKQLAVESKNTINQIRVTSVANSRMGST